MSNLWLRFKIWAKVTLVAAVFVYVVLFTYFNASEKVKFWYWFHRQPETTLLLLVVCAFLAGIVTSFLVRTTFRTIRQVHDLQDRTRTQRLDREVADMKAKAAMLQTKSSSAPSEGTPARTPERESGEGV